MSVWKDLRVEFMWVESKSYKKRGRLWVGECGEGERTKLID